MAYADVIRLAQILGSGITSTGNLVEFTSRRRCRVLGYGIATTDRFIAGTGATGGTVTLQRSTDGGATFSNVDSITLPNANHPAGTAYEKSELLRGVEGVTSPSGVLAAIDLAPGHVIRVAVTTAQVAGTGGTAGRYTAYLILAPSGSP